MGVVNLSGVNRAFISTLCLSAVIAVVSRVGSSQRRVDVLYARSIGASRPPAISSYCSRSS